MGDSKTLIGRQDICDYLRISGTTYYKLIREEGLPVYRRGRQAIANTDLLDKWSQEKVKRARNT